MNKCLYAILPVADGQPPQKTQHPAIYQDAVAGGARAAGKWLADPEGLTLVEYLDTFLSRMPGSVTTAAHDGFLLRIDQRLMAVKQSPTSVVPTALINQTLLFETLQASVELADEHLEITGHALKEYTRSVRTLKAQATEIAYANTRALLATDISKTEQGGAGHD